MNVEFRWRTYVDDAVVQQVCGARGDDSGGLLN